MHNVTNSESSIYLSENEDSKKGTVSEIQGGNIIIISKD